jgi:NADPH:quinone reductase-like Zn-dependent oxidoreductase
MAAIQVAKILGATVFTTGRSDTELVQVKLLGADHFINTSPRPGEDLVSFCGTTTQPYRSPAWLAWCDAAVAKAMTSP